MSFLYPSTISISRPDVDDGVGARGYGGAQKKNETTIATGIKAHIQADRQGTRPQTGLPGDAAGESIWKVIFKGAKGLVRNRDIITDDLGLRYQVISADWGSLVTSCRCQILET